MVDFRRKEYGYQFNFATQLRSTQYSLQMGVPPPPVRESTLRFRVLLFLRNEAKSCWGIDVDCFVGSFGESNFSFLNRNSGIIRMINIT
jgi:hypothetical protein